jgi:hypothetical protein
MDTRRQSRVLAALSFVYPHLMVGPGKLIPGHKGLESDCFACHARLSRRRFRALRELPQAGRHRQADLRRHTHQSRSRHDEDTLSPEADQSGLHGLPQRPCRRETLSGCTVASTMPCCKRMRDELCQSCHVAPKDALHQKISGNCGQCHSQEKWTPATFDHEKSFVLDRDHNVKCVTCHVRNDYSRYTCYGCHEHTPANIRREHIEEGIRDYDNCVECHRNADKHDIRGEYGNARGERKGKKDRKKRDHD